MLKVLVVLQYKVHKELKEQQVLKVQVVLQYKVH